MILNKKCFCCSTRYSYCPDCSGADRLKESWYATFCSEDCMTIWTTCTKFNMGRLTKPEAKEIISALNLKPTSEYASCVQKDLAVILKEESKPKRNKRIEVKPIDEAANIEPTFTEETIHHEVVNQENE